VGEASHLGESAAEAEEKDKNKENTSFHTVFSFKSRLCVLLIVT